MQAMLKTFAASAALACLLATAAAQDHSRQGHDMAAIELPGACRAGEPPQMAGMEQMRSAMESVGAHQKGLMEAMMRANGPMMQGMMAEDPDVAFACAMIPHHQGAIDLAKVQLQHGDDEELKQMAQKMIDHQTREIEELRNLIE